MKETVPIPISPRAIAEGFIAARRKAGPDPVLDLAAVVDLAAMLRIDRKTARAVLESKKFVIDDESCKVGRPAFWIRDHDHPAPAVRGPGTPEKRR
jgi:hypothetical protein